MTRAPTARANMRRIKQLVLRGCHVSKGAADEELYEMCRKSVVRDNKRAYLEACIRWLGGVVKDHAHGGHRRMHQQMAASGLITGTKPRGSKHWYWTITDRGRELIEKGAHAMLYVPGIGGYCYSDSNQEEDDAWDKLNGITATTPDTPTACDPPGPAPTAMPS